MIRFGNDYNVVSRVSKLLRSGIMDSPPLWYNVALRHVPVMHYPVLKPPKLVSSMDRLHRAFDKEFMRVHRHDPNTCLLPDKFEYGGSDQEESNCNFRAEFISRWDQLLKEQPDLAISPSFDQVTAEMTDRLEEAKTRMTMLLRTQLDPSNKFAGEPISEIFRQKELDRADEIIAKRRKRNQAMAGDGLGSTDNGESKMTQSLGQVENEIARRRAAEDWAAKE